MNISQILFGKTEGKIFIKILTRIIIKKYIIFRSIGVSQDNDNEYRIDVEGYLLNKVTQVQY